MNVKMTITLAYDPAKDGKLKQFREKYFTYRDHIARMQSSGLLPANVKFVVEKQDPEPPRPAGPAQIIPFSRALLPVHCAGERLDLRRMAL